MDREQAESAADVLMDVGRANKRAKATKQAVPHHQRSTGIGALVGFGLGMVVGGFLLESTFPASLIGTVLGALAGRYLGSHLARPKA